MKNFLTYLAILLLSGCHTSTKSNQLITLGDADEAKAWVYLCGLTSEWDSHEETNNRNILERIAIAEQIKIIALKPAYRCKKFDDKLCWPHENNSQLHNTYASITKEVPLNQIAGFIGFSNGGFFLNRLSQEIELNQPIISIGSSGYLNTTTRNANKIYLVISKEDVHHYADAINFYNQAKGHKYFKIELIEYDGGHIIPEVTVKQLIHKLIAQSNNLKKVRSE